MVKNEQFIDVTIDLIKSKYPDIASEYALRYIITHKLEKFLNIITRNATLVDLVLQEGDIESLSNSSEETWRELEKSGMISIHTIR